MPQKGKVRLVFDSAAKFYGRNLNDSFLHGPDRNNALRAVLTRFRRGLVGFSADIEMMFHQFFVPKSECTYLRFFWFQDNDPRKPLVEYWACVHIMGNKGSPAIANFGLRVAAQDQPDPTKVWHTELPYEEIPEATSNSHDAVETFITQQLYVDDALGSEDSEEQAIQVLKGAVHRLGRYNIRLCKVCSNRNEVYEAFEQSERQPMKVDLCQTTGASTPFVGTQSLGLSWDTRMDTLQMKVAIKDNPFTRRGLLSHIMTPYDPFGMSAPVQGRR